MIPEELWKANIVDVLQRRNALIDMAQSAGLTVDAYQVHFLYDIAVLIETQRAEIARLLAVDVVEQVAESEQMKGER